MLQENKGIVIFGTGNLANNIYESMKNKEDVQYFVDNDKEKQNSTFKGKKVYSPLKVIEDKERIIIIVASMYSAEITQQLSDYGLIPGIDFYVPKKEKEYGKFSGVVYGVPKNLKVIKSIDDIGNLVVDEHNKKIYRVVRKESIEKTKKILGILKKNNIDEKFLVNTTVMNDKRIIDREFVLEHKYVENISYIFEWSINQIKDCGKFCLDFLLELNKVGLALKDIHSYNVTFYNGKFIWLDFGSITEKKITISLIYEFINTYINTIFLLNMKPIIRISRNLDEESIEYSDIEGFLSNSQKKEYKNNIERVNQLFKLNKIEELIYYLKYWIDNIPVVEINSNWNNYQDNEIMNLDDYTLWSEKNKKVISMIDRISDNIETIIDIAGNSGFYCFAMSNKQKKCVLCDLDEIAIEKAYSRIKKYRYKNIIPIICRIGKESASNLKPMELRFKSDLVLAVAIEHHLIFQQQFTFEEIVDMVYKLSNRYLLIEFALPEDIFVSKWMNENFGWYNYDNFYNVLSEKFGILYKEIYDKTRVLLMCEKIVNYTNENI